MRITRKTWVSAGIVGVILAGGISVAAAASAGMIEKAGDPPPTAPQEREGHPPSSQNPTISPEPSHGATPPPEDYVLSREINPDPEKVLHYWSDQRMEEAEPYPMPQGPLGMTE